MVAADDRLYEYAVVRYVPKVDREEFMNIGLIMMCKRRRWLRGEIRLNEGRLRALDPHCNFESLASQASIFSRGDVPSKELPVEERYRWLAAVKSAVLQVSPSHPGLLSEQKVSPAEDESDSEAELDNEFERLMRELVL